MYVGKEQELLVGVVGHAGEARLGEPVALQVAPVRAHRLLQAAVVGDVLPEGELAVHLGRAVGPCESVVTPWSSAAI